MGEGHNTNGAELVDWTPDPKGWDWLLITTFTVCIIAAFAAGGGE